ncbi:MAG TPA: 50S ribosomal protein L15 [Clostridia bacterium]|jgi:large subunit ribosomal protein L15|nr:50S ribosomal protein L15 [Clostridia bacterium]HPY43889.1 50S ribosomal protein L15 [Clostridia bacterium]HQA97606.1 50S ribosomal protein L15 [Clostridia bacterium]HQO55859.1 50S ribosomal protein L15 [Clostridia bacterium]
MKLHELQPLAGSKTRPRRVGRGIGSGLGKTSGRGHKGAKARSGGGKAPGFEGGQMPLMRRIPKSGFKNVFRKEYAIVNVGSLEQFDDGATVTIETLRSAGLVNNLRDGVKVLGTGELTKKLTVQVNRFTGSAREKIEQAGGKAEEV